MTDLIVHKATPECPITQPHAMESCGFVQSRRRHQQEGDAASRRQHEAEDLRDPKR